MSAALSVEELEMYAQGYRGWTFRPSLIGGTTTPTTQQVFYAQIALRGGIPITGLDAFWSNTPSGLTLCKVGLYDVASLARVAVSADVSASANSYNGASSGKFRTPFSAIFTPTDDRCYYAAIITVGSGTFPQLGRGAASAGASVASASGVRPWGFQASQSDLPATAALSSASSPVWFGAY